MDFGLNSVFPQRVLVAFEGYGGARVGHMFDWAHSIFARCDAPVDVVYLHIGGNDITDETIPHTLAKSVIALAEYLQESFGVRQVVISQVLFRDRAYCTRFNDRAYDVNGSLKTLLQQDYYTERGLILWMHKGFSDPAVRSLLMDRDGVHFNDAGNAKLYKSIKSSLIQALKRL